MISKDECLNSPQVSLQSILSQAATVLPGKTAINYGGSQRVTFQELDELSNKFACALVALGVLKGDRVALFLWNSPHFVIAFFGVLKAGAVVTAVNPLYKERELEEQLCDSGAQTIVVLDSLYPIVEKLGKALLKNVIVTGVDTYSNAVNVKASLNVLSFWDLIIKERSCKQPIVSQFGVAGDLAVLQYTGGTTGSPKGVMLTHGNLLSNARSFGSHLEGVSRDVFLSVLPFCHVYGMTASMITPINLGAEMVLLPKFDAVKSLQAIEQYRVTVFCGSPTMYAMMLTSSGFEKHDLSSIRVCISGASPLPAQVQRGFLRAGVFLVEGYGLTEASPVTHCTPISRSCGSVRIGSIGVPLIGTETRIVDLETGRKALPTGEPGELTVRGSQVMQGYWQRPEETAQVLKDGWLQTGDIAYKDKDDHYYIIDRKKDLIKHKGYTIYPNELEKILQEHPDVKHCTIIGKPDKLTGENPKAYVVLKDCVKMTAQKGEELLEFVNRQTASYKAIRGLEFCQELPISSSGKILKYVIKS